MSVDHKIHIANKSNQPYYVLVVPNSDWTWADLASIPVTGIAAYKIGSALGGVSWVVNTINSIRGLATLLQAAKVLSTLKTLYDAGQNVKALLEAQKLGQIADLTGSDVEIMRARAREFLEKNAVQILPSEYKEVFDTNMWNPISYLSPSKIGSAFGASNVTVFLCSADLNTHVTFNTNGDYSWIIGTKEIQRSRYGTIMKEDRDSGYIRLGLGRQVFAPATLRPGDCLVSDNGKYNFVFQPDGNAVVYKRDMPADEDAKWSSKTHHKAERGEFRVQSDGNVVVYDEHNKPVWHAQTYAGENTMSLSRLVMQDDGNLVLYRPDGKAAWSTEHGLV
ncbi:MAG: hypothetical protein JSR60_12675 [Proteobacteria bacterium]|nr:hypothetical protein [Pseudomonadota bacterium]